MSTKLALSVLGIPAFLVIPALADTTTTIVPSSNWGTWEGWGTSLAWWAKAFGNRDDLSNIFYTLNTTTFNGVSLPGLGFNIARYNAGACSTVAVGTEKMVVSPNIKASRQIDGFWTNWNTTDPNTSSWNWNVDANQRAALTKAKARGANRFELFSNSPMWWMCTNHNPSGHSSASTDNLQSWNQEQHTVYLATVAAYARDHWGVTFDAVEPFNEPASNYWSATGTQEGCHFNVASQPPVINYLRTQLNSRGLTSTIVAASDETSYDQAITTFDGYGSAALANIGRINVHGYQGAGGKRDVLYSRVSGARKALWNSEYGESDATGSSLASNLILDFRWLHQTAWIYWQVIDGGGWGLIDGNNDNLTLGAPSQKYFVLAQFTRHIRVGMRILDGGSSNTVAAYDSAAKKLVVVAVNWGAAQYLNFELASFSGRPANGTVVKRWYTQIGSGSRYVAASDTTISGTKFWSYFNTNVIMTFEVTGVTL